MRTSQRMVIGLFALLLLGAGGLPEGLFAQQQGQQGQPGQFQQPNGGEVRAPWKLPLDPAHQKYVDDILKYWEFRSGEEKLKTFRATFYRWEYDPVFGPQDPNTAKTISEGVLQYAAPDKGLYKVERTRHFAPPRAPGEEPQYLERTGEVGEHWVTDGQSIYQFDHRKQQLIQTILPREMQGKAIADGPLPFMFGANAERLKQRYWIQVITPKEVTGEYWLEVAPKTQDDYAQFRLARIILDEKDFLPKAVQLFHARSRTTFELAERHVNENNLLDRLNVFKREFHEPALPRGWQKVVDDLSAPPQARQAQRP